MLELYYKRVSC